MSVAQRLRQKLLDLAIHGKLVSQCAKDEPAGIRNVELGIRNCQRKGKTGLTGFTGLRGGKRNPVNHVNPVKKYTPVTDDEKPFDLPRGWVWCRLGEIGIWGAGATPSRKNPKYYEGGKIPWLKTGDLNDGLVMHIPECITQDALAETSVRLNPIGSVLIAMYGATIGKVGILGVEATTNQACCVCQPEGAVDNQFLFYYLMSQREQFKRLGGGGAQPNISKELIVSYPIPLPPLEEQKRIVEKLNAMLKEATRVAEGTERLAQLRKKARAKILDLAIRGKLVKQEKSDEPATELLNRISAEKVKLVSEKKIKKEKPLPPIADDEMPFELPSGWSWCRLGELATKVGAGSTPKGGKSVYVDEGVKFIREQNVYCDGLHYDGIVYIDALTNKRMSGTIVRPGDLLMNITGGSIGRTALVPDGFDEGNVNQHVLIVRPVECATKEYLHLCCCSSLIVQLMLFRQTGDKPGLSAEKVKSFPIPLPPLAEQRRIVAKVKEMLAACDAFGGEG